MTTLPQPKLMQLGMAWLVTAGSLKLNNAFTHQDDAIAFAKSLDSNGTPVWLGHTVFGWCDFFNPRDTEEACTALVTQWRDGFMADDWHKAQWSRAITHGDQIR